MQTGRTAHRADSFGERNRQLLAQVAAAYRVRVVAGVDVGGVRPAGQRRDGGTRDDNLAHLANLGRFVACFRFVFLYGLPPRFWYLQNRYSRGIASFLLKQKTASELVVLFVFCLLLLVSTSRRAEEDTRSFLVVCQRINHFKTRIRSEISIDQVNSDRARA